MGGLKDKARCVDSDEANPSTHFGHFDDDHRDEWKRDSGR